MNLKPLLVLSAIALIGFAAPTASARTYWSVGIGFGYPYGYGYPSYGYPYYGGYYPYGYGYGYPSYGYSYSPYSYGYSSYRPVYRGGYSSTSYRGGSTSYRGGSVVVQVQQRLARAGYYHGRVDGVMGSQTRSAIRAYQRAHSMRVDGMLNDQLLGTMGLRR